MISLLSLIKSKVHTDYITYNAHKHGQHSVFMDQASSPFSPASALEPPTAPIPDSDGRTAASIAACDRWMHTGSTDGYFWAGLAGFRISYCSGQQALNTLPLLPYARSIHLSSPLIDTLKASASTATQLLLKKYRRDCELTLVFWFTLTR